MEQHDKALSSIMIKGNGRGMMIKGGVSQSIPFLNISKNSEQIFGKYLINIQKFNQHDRGDF